MPYLATLWQTDAQDNAAHRLRVCSKEVAGGFFAVAERRGREQSGGVGAVPFGKIGRAVAYDVDNIGQASAVERAFMQVGDELRLDLTDYIVTDGWQISAQVFCPER